MHPPRINGSWMPCLSVSFYVGSPVPRRFRSCIFFGQDTRGLPTPGLLKLFKGSAAISALFWRDWSTMRESGDLSLPDVPCRKSRRAVPGAAKRSFRHALWIYRRSGRQMVGVCDVDGGAHTYARGLQRPISGHSQHRDFTRAVDFQPGRCRKSSRHEGQRRGTELAGRTSVEDGTRRPRRANRIE